MAAPSPFERTKMGRPRIHPRKRYRALDSGVYVDQEKGYEFTYVRYQTVLPDTRFHDIPIAEQERIARALAASGIFESLDEIERVSSAPAEIKQDS